MTTVGIWVWEAGQIGTPTLADWAAAGVARVYVKAGDGVTPWTAQLAALLPQIKALGMETYGWSYVRGEAGEEGPAIAALKAGVDGWVIDAEREVEDGGNAWTPAQYCAALRAVADKPILMSSFGQPKAHPKMGWSAWGAAVDGFCPQIFPFLAGWPGSNADTITLMYQQYSSYTNKPLYPVGELWRDEVMPVVVGNDVFDFLANCQAGGYDHASLFRAGIMGQDVADAVRTFAGPVAPVASLEQRVANIEAFLGSTFKGWTT
jgi:hypothetical protein